MKVFGEPEPEPEYVQERSICIGDTAFTVSDAGADTEEAVTVTSLLGEAELPKEL